MRPLKHFAKQFCGSAEYSSKARRKGEAGAVLLTTLLIMSIMAVLAVMILDQTRISIRRSANIQMAAQADWYARASEDFAKQRLVQWSNGDAVVLDQLLQTPQTLTFPLQGGVMRFSIRDSAQCLPVGALDAAPPRRAFTRLVSYVTGLSLEAENLTAAIVDWQDADSEIRQGGAEDYDYMARASPHRTSNTSIVNIAELRAVKGISEPIYQTLRPFVCGAKSDIAASQESAEEARGVEKIKVNINTLSKEQAPILAAILGEEKRELSLKLLRERPAGGYEDKAALLTVLMADSSGEGVEDLDLISYKIETVWIEVEVSLGAITRYAAYEFEIDNGKVTRTYRTYSQENFRPILEELETDKT